MCKKSSSFSIFLRFKYNPPYIRETLARADFCSGEPLHSAKNQFPSVSTLVAHSCSSASCLSGQCCQFHVVGCLMWCCRAYTNFLAQQSVLKQNLPDIILPFGLADWSLELRQALYVFPFVLAKEKPTFR